MATTNRVGSLTLITDTMRDVSASQVKLADLQTQISSGYKSRDFEGMNGSVEQFTQITNQLDRSTQYKTNNMVNITKLQTADAALSKIIEITDKIKNAIVGANGAVIPTSNLPQVVSDLLASLGGELNTTFNGHYIFGGIDTVNAPVPTTTISPDSPGLPDDNYYAGSKENAWLRADDRTDVVFPVRADDFAFQQIYAAAKFAIEAASRNDSVNMQRAQQLIQAGQSDLIAVRSRVGTTVNNLETVNDRLVAVSAYWKQLTDDMSKTDIVAASSEVASYQAILQASFQVYARLSQLRLSDYLK